MSPDSPLVFDGHNDVLTRLLRAGGVAAAEQFIAGSAFHVDLPKAKAGGLGGGLFAIWVASPSDAQDPFESMVGGGYSLPLPPPLSREQALDDVLEEAAILHRLETLGALKVCTQVSEIRACFDAGTLAAVMHIEGAEVIDHELHALDLLYRAGLRSLGPVWSRHTRFADGVPFRFPSSPDVGGGLTEDGQRLVKRCNELGIVVDVSHMTERGFNDVAAISTAPLVASHSNAHALCPSARNLTDRQLDVIADSDGLVGLNFAAAFLRDDGQMRRDVPMSTVLRHLDHLLAHLGEDGVALGSDFDGAVVPESIGDASGLPVLIEAMLTHGYGLELVRKISHENWLRLLERTWV